MKKLTLPPYVDNVILLDLSRNTRVGSHPLLGRNLQRILTQYTLYQQHGGNPWNLNIINIPTALADALETHYDRPPVVLDMIEDMRHKDSPDVCPMCGSSFTSELDHFLPQDDYPWFTVLTKNLIPACKCNRIKGTTVMGTNQAERFLHPYYDNCLNNRLLTCSIIGNYLSPVLSINTYNGNCNTLTVNYHIDELIKNTNILNYLDKKWVQLTRKPRSIIKTFPSNRINTIFQCRNMILDCLNLYDEEYGTPNNWISALISGILNDANVIQWICYRHNGILDGSIVVN